jgi:hypothetical protein
MNLGIRLGFAGTQAGMTAAQRGAVFDYVESILHDVMWAIHGGCVGADEQFHLICEVFGIGIEVYPSNLPGKQSRVIGEVMHRPMNPLRRNGIIARECTHLIAAPKEFVERVRSGTWTTVRYGRKAGRSIVMVYPDGRIAR